MGRILTYEIIKENVEVSSGSSCVLLTTKNEYFEQLNTGIKASDAVLRLICRCGNEFAKKYQNFKNVNNPQYICKDCGLKVRGEKKGTPYSEISDFIKNKTDCVLLTTEIEFNQIKDKEKLYHSKVPIKLQCTCGRKFSSNFHNFKHNNKKLCSKCGKKQAGKKNGFTFSQIEEYMNKTECKLITTQDEFLKSNEMDSSGEIDLKIQCGCGEVFLLNFNRFKNQGKRNCNFCSMEKIKEERSIPYSIMKNNIETVGCELITSENELKEKANTLKLSPSAVKLTILCKECKKNTFKRSYTTFNRPSHQCAKCSRKIKALNMRKTHEEYVYEVNGKFGINEYTILEQYETGSVKILTRHNSTKCNYYEWHVTPISLLNGTGCPVCRETKGEFSIRNILNHNKVSLLPQYEFDNLRSDLNIKLKFDFAVLDKKNELVFLIEYDGEQHFDHYSSWMTKEKYERLRIHDTMKNNYCKDNNIRLLRIPYWEFDNIESIVQKELVKYKLI